MTTTPTLAEALALIDAAIADYDAEGWSSLAVTYRAARNAITEPNLHTSKARQAVTALVRRMANGEDTVRAETVIEFLRDGDIWFA